MRLVKVRKARENAAMGGEAVRVGIPKLMAGAYVPRLQDDAAATLAPILKKEDGVVPWSKSSRNVHDHVRGMNPWPGAHCVHRGKSLKVLVAGKLFKANNALRNSSCRPNDH